MQVHLAYGRHGFDVELPDSADILLPQRTPALPEPETAVREARRQPKGSRARAAPHIFPGYSGGGKAVLPGIAGADIIMSNHGVDMLNHPKATWCETEGNPIFEEMRDVALATHPAFLVNVSLNEKKEITGVFAGEMAAAHEAGMAQAGRQALHALSRPHAL